MYNQPTALRSVLAPEYLEHCLSRLYDIGPWKQCLFWLRGLNDTYRVETPDGFYILRVYRSEVSESDVNFEVSLLTELRRMMDATTHVSEPIPKNDSTLYTVLNAPEGERITVIFRYLKGIEHPLDDEASCYAFGRSAAALHAAMDLVTIAQPRFALDTDFLIQQPLKRICEYIGLEHQAVPFLREFAVSLQKRIEIAAASGLDWRLCHGDMHGNNNAFLEGEQFTHYDFEWASKGWRAYDLAQVKARKRQSREKQDALWNSLMSGYRSVRHFSDEDEQAIELFIMARRFWVMGLDVAFIHQDTGALDYGEAWLNGFLEEFRHADHRQNIRQQMMNAYIVLKE